MKFLSPRKTPSLYQLFNNLASQEYYLKNETATSIKYDQIKISKSNPRFLAGHQMAYGEESISGDTSTSAFQRRKAAAICAQQWGSSYAEQAGPRV